ncbi:hypothetical protein [Burkholderia sp. LMG 32019]|uniref:hypothetical protein n=1 Tax=Burkholderia sp. LMG 32019 TaxID=3158173 RepID=UPI003C3002D3
MKLWMSGEVDADIGGGEHVARNVIEPIVNGCLDKISFLEGFEKWAFISIILSDKFLPGFPEVAKISSKGKVLEFRLRIPREIFKQASSEIKISMLFYALNRSVEMMSKLEVSPESQEKFRVALRRAREYLSVN